MALAITHLIESVRAVLFVNRNTVRLYELYHRHLFISIPILAGIAFSSIYLNSRYFFVHFAMPAYCFVRLIKRQPFCIIFEAKNATSSVNIRFLSHFNSSPAIACFLYFARTVLICERSRVCLFPSVCPPISLFSGLPAFRASCATTAVHVLFSFSRIVFSCFFHFRIQKRTFDKRYCFSARHGIE